MEKVDFKKKYADLYKASDKKVTFIEPPILPYLAVDGKGHPEKHPDFSEAVGAFYGIAYTLKFDLKLNVSKRPKGYYDFVVPPFSMQWYMADGKEFDANRTDDWRWTMLMMIPDYASEKLINNTIEILKDKKNTKIPESLRVISFTDGKSAQIMHIGPYDQVDRSYNKILEEFENRGLKINGKHHEVYLSDPRRTSPEKIKTIARLPYA